MIKEKNEVTANELHPAIVTNVTDGWVGSGFNTRWTEMKVRRIPAGKGGSDVREHVQIELCIKTTKGESNRLYATYGSFVLTPEQVDKLVSALQNPVKY